MDFCVKDLSGIPISGAIVFEPVKYIAQVQFWGDDPSGILNLNQ